MSISNRLSLSSCLVRCRPNSFPSQDFLWNWPGTFLKLLHITQEKSKHTCHDFKQNGPCGSSFTPNRYSDWREERKLKSRFWFLAVSKTSLPPTVQQATTKFHLDWTVIHKKRVLEGLRCCERFSDYLPLGSVNTEKSRKMESFSQTIRLLVSHKHK